MKKYILLSVLVLMLFILGGCSMKIDLTASEHDKIAEYAAYALLADADKYEDKLLPKEEVDKIIAERELESQIKEEIENLDKHPTTRPQETVRPQETTKPDDTDNPVTKPSKNEDVVVKNISEIMGIENVNIEYSGYELCEIFPNDTSEFVVLKAKNGKQFVALSFVLQNTSSQQTECNILAKDIVYRLHLSNGESYKSMLTAMGSDFGTWNTPLAPQSMNMAFMVFEVPDTVTEQDMIDAELSFRENKNTQTVVLK